MAGIKAKNKEDELQVREKLEGQNAVGRYDKLLEKCKAARDHAAHPHFQTGFKTRKKAVDNSFKALVEATKITPENLETKEDLKPLSKPFKDLKDAVDRLDEFTFDFRRDCLELQAHLNKYDDAPLLCNQMKQAATWNHKKGIVEIKKIK